jgi:methionyl-tRNA formyltransferase
MIIVAGKNNIAVHALNTLVASVGVERLKVVANKTDDGMDSWQLSLKKRSAQLGVECITLEEAEEVAEVFLSLEFDRIVKPENFKNSRSLYNIHFSALPRYKGMYTSIWPILHFDSSSAVTLHRIDAGIDTGEIVDQLSFEIQEADSSKDLYLKYISNACRLFDNNIARLIGGNPASSPQAIEGSTYYSKAALNFATLVLNLNQTAWQIGRQIRAYSFRDYQLPKLNGTAYCNYEVLATQTRKKPGTVLSDCEEFTDFSTIDYDIRLYKDQLAHVFELAAEDDGSRLSRYEKNLVNIDDRNSKSWTLLMVAAYNGNLALAEFLISRGADVNAQNYKGTTVLMYAKDYALAKGDSTLFKLLLSHGADVAVADYTGKALRDYLTRSEAAALGIDK